MQEIIDVEAEGLELKKQLEVVKIVDQPSYDAVVEARVGAKDWLKKTGEFFESLRKPAWDAYQNILDKKKAVIGPVEKHVENIDRAIVKWDEEQKEIERKEQARLAAIAQQAAEEERLKTAIVLEEAGASPESVAVVLSAPASFVAAPLAAPAYTRSSSVVLRDNFSAEITDFFSLVKYVAKNKKDLNLLVGIEYKAGKYIAGTTLNQQARSLKETLAIPGVRAVNNKGVAGGRG